MEGDRAPSLRGVPMGVLEEVDTADEDAVLLKSFGLRMGDGRLRVGAVVGICLSAATAADDDCGPGVDVLVG